MEIALLGCFVVVVDGQVVGVFEYWCGVDFVKVLVFVLGYWFVCDCVVELLWFVFGVDVGVANLYKVVYYACCVFGGCGVVVFWNGFVELVFDVMVMMDVECFEVGEDVVYGGLLLFDDEYELWVVLVREWFLQFYVEWLRCDGCWEELLVVDLVVEDVYCAFMCEVFGSGDWVIVVWWFWSLCDELFKFGLQLEEEMFVLVGELVEGFVVEVLFGMGELIFGCEEEFGFILCVL